MNLIKSRIIILNVQSVKSLDKDNLTAEASHIMQIV